MRHLNQRAADRDKVRGRAVAVAGKQFGNAGTRHKLAREHPIERRQANGTVGDDLHGRATMAEENDRAEHGVCGHSDDEFLGVWPPRH